MIREKKSHVIRKHLRKPRLPILMDYQKYLRHLRGGYTAYIEILKNWSGRDNTLPPKI